MKSSRIAVGLVVAIFLQLLILSGMVAKAALPLWSGTEIRVRTVPYDPRSLFRGNYARLNYDISRLPGDALEAYPRPRIGEVVYVSLKEGDGGIYEYADALLEPPESGLFIRGRISSNRQPYAVKYGIEAFFAPKEKALKLERELIAGGVAVLMVDDSGNVALKHVTADLSSPDAIGE